MLTNSSFHDPCSQDFWPVLWYPKSQDNPHHNVPYQQRLHTRCSTSPAGTTDSLTWSTASRNNSISICSPSLYSPLLPSTTNRMSTSWLQMADRSALYTAHQGPHVNDQTLLLMLSMFQELRPNACGLLKVVISSPQGINEKNINCQFPTIPAGKTCLTNSALCH